MTGEMNLGKLLAEMAPTLQDGRFVFVTLENGRYGDYPYLSPIASFSEPEGLTLVIPQTAADQAGLVYDATFNCITLLVHSSLEAVGLTAAVMARVGEARAALPPGDRQREALQEAILAAGPAIDRKSTRLNSSH